MVTEPTLLCEITKLEKKNKIYKYSSGDACKNTSKEKRQYYYFSIVFHLKGSLYFIVVK